MPLQTSEKVYYLLVFFLKGENYMENQVTQLLKAMVKPDYTACSYAFMQNGKIVCADAIGVIDKINKDRKSVV